MEEISIPESMVQVIRSIYANQEAKVRTEYCDTESFSIGKDVRQWCVLSPYLFNMTQYRGRRGMSARLRLNAPWLENCVRHDCDISNSECVNISVYRMHVTRV